MGNCLVTRLQESVNNDNLHYFGYARLIISTPEQEVKTVIEIAGSGTYKVKYNDGTTQTSSFDGLTRIAQNTGGECLVECANFISLVSFWGVDIDELYPYNKIEYIKSAYIKGDFSRIPSSVTNIIDEGGSSLSGDINDPSSIALQKYLFASTDYVGAFNFTTFANNQVLRGRISGSCRCGVRSYRTINFGTSMVDPTAEDTERGWQII